MADEQVIEAATQDTPDVPSQSETQPEATPEAGETTAPETDWQVKATEAEQRAERAENNLRAERGRATKQVERDNSLFELADRMGAMEQSNMALVRALSSGETEQLPDQLAQIQNASTGRSATRSYEGRYTTLATELQSIVHDMMATRLSACSTHRNWKQSGNSGWHRITSKTLLVSTMHSTKHNG